MLQQAKINVPSKIILHLTNICFSEYNYFRVEYVEFSMNYKLCELHITYTILSKFVQNTHFIQIAPCHLRSFHCFEMLQVRENEISLRNSSGGPEYLRTLEGTFLTMQCKWMFTTLYPFYKTTEMPCVAVTITKKRFVGRNSQVY